MSLVSAKRTVAILGASLPSYVPTLPGQVVSVPGNTMQSVFPVSGVDYPSNVTLGSPAAFGLLCQGGIVFNKYYGQNGALVCHNTIGHASQYYGNEVYIGAFGASGLTWVRWTRPFPVPDSLKGCPYAFNQPGLWDLAHGEYLLNGADFYGKSWAGDHTRSHQVATSGGTGGLGRVFYPKTASNLGGDGVGGSCGGSSTYGTWPHILNCGVETGTPTYDSTKVWTTRGNNASPIPHAFGGGCVFDETSGIVWYLGGNGTVETVIARFDMAANDWLSNLTFSGSINVSADQSLEYIQSRKLALTVYNTNGNGAFLIDLSGPTPIPRTLMSWAAPTTTNIPTINATGWGPAAYSNVPKYCPVDGNFYCLLTNSVFSPGGTARLLKFVPPFDLRTSITNAQAMATVGSGTWSDITPSLSAPILTGSIWQLWGPYKSFWWHDAFSCFIWCPTTTGPVQLIKVP